MPRSDEGLVSVIDLTLIQDGDVVRFQDDRYLYQLHARRGEKGQTCWDAWRQDTQHPTLDNGQPLWDPLLGRLTVNGCYLHVYARRFTSASGEEIHQSIPLEPVLGKLMIGLHAWLVSIQIDDRDYRSIQTGPITGLAVFRNKQQR